jgi:hypothetical protein
VATRTLAAIPGCASLGRDVLASLVLTTRQSRCSFVPRPSRA